MIYVRAISNFEKQNLCRTDQSRWGLLQWWDSLKWRVVVYNVQKIWDLEFPVSGHFLWTSNFMATCFHGICSLPNTLAPSLFWFVETLPFNFSECMYLPLYFLLTVSDKLVCWYAQQHQYPTTTHSLYHALTGRSAEPAQCWWLQNICNTQHQPCLSLEALPVDVADLSHTWGVRVTEMATVVASLRLCVLF